MCTKPVACVLSSQEDLNTLIFYELIEIELSSSDTSLYSEIIKELLDMPTNRNFVIQRFSEVIKQFPGTSLDALIPANIEPTIKEKLTDIYRMAAQKTEKRSPFKLVFMNEGGKKILKGVPTSE